MQSKLFSEHVTEDMSQNLCHHSTYLDPGQLINPGLRL